MTIETQVAEVTLPANGVVTTWTYPFLIPESSDAVVSVIDSGGTETTLLTSQYTISGIGDSDGGIVTYPLSGSPLASGNSLRIKRVLPIIQATELENQGAWYPSSVEDALDYITMVMQQLQYQIDGVPAVLPISGYSILYGGVSTGSANAQILAGISFDAATYQPILFKAGFTPTGPCTLKVGSAAAVAIQKDAGAGSAALVGGEFTAGDIVLVVFDVANAVYQMVGGVNQFAAMTALSGDIASGDLFALNDVSVPGQRKATYGTLLNNIAYSRRNFAYNTQFAVANRIVAAGTTVADNAYGPDRWRYIGEGNSSVFAPVAVQASLASGVSARVGEVAPSAGNLKAGLFQVLPNRDVLALRGKTMTFAALLQVSNVRLGDMRMAVVEWTGTADATTGDPISSWGTSGNPTLAAGWAYLNTPANLNVTASPAQYSISVAVGASANNLALMIWNNDQAFTITDFFLVTQVQFVLGTVLPFYVPPSWSQDAYECNEFCWKSFAMGTAPAQNVGVSTGELLWSGLLAGAVAVASAQFFHPRRMFKQPSVTLYNPAAANGEVRNETDSADCSASSANNRTDKGFRIFYTGNAGAALGETFGVHVLVDAEI